MKKLIILTGFTWMLAMRAGRAVEAEERPAIGLIPKAHHAVVMDGNLNT